jgi:hypothetical protein
MKIDKKQLFMIIGIFLIFIGQLNAEEEKSVTVKGGTKTSVLFESLDDSSFIIIANVATGWIIKSAEVSNSALWRPSYSDSYARAISNAAVDDITELFTVTLYGDIVTSGPGGAGPVPTYEVKGEHSAGLYISPMEEKVGINQKAKFDALLKSNGEPIKCNWKVYTREGGTEVGSSDSPTSTYSISLENPGYYSIEAVKDGGSANSKALLTVIKVEIKRIQTGSVTFPDIPPDFIVTNANYKEYLDALGDIDKTLRKAAKKADKDPLESGAYMVESLKEAESALKKLPNILLGIGYTQITPSGSFNMSVDLMEWEIKVLPSGESAKVKIETEVKEWTTTKSFGDLIATGLPNEINVTGTTTVKATPTKNGGTQNITFSHDYGSPFKDSIKIKVPDRYTEEFHLSIVRKSADKEAEKIRKILSKAKERFESIKDIAFIIKKMRFSGTYGKTVPLLCQVINDSCDTMNEQFNAHIGSDWMDMVEFYVNHLYDVEKKLAQREPAGEDDTDENTKSLQKYIMSLYKYIFE